MVLYISFRNFLKDVAQNVQKSRNKLGLDRKKIRGAELYVNRLTVSQIAEFTQMCLEKYEKAKIEPGE